MVRRTKEEAEQTRSAILDAAERLFFEQGVARTTLEAIARAAGVTRGAVYWHFRDKVALFEAMQARARLPQEDILHCLFTQEESERSLERLSEALKAILRIMSTDLRRRRVFAILFHRCEYVEEMQVIAQRKQDHVDQTLERLTRFFEAAAQRGELSAHWSPPVAALAVHGLVIGLLSRMLEGTDPRHSVDLAQDCVTAFFRSLAGTVAGAVAGTVPEAAVPGAAAP